VSVEDCELRPRGFSQPIAALVFSTGSLPGTISSHTLGRVLCSSYCGIESICGTLIEATGRVTVRGSERGRETDLRSSSDFHHLGKGERKLPLVEFDCCLSQPQILDL
jgi:hypothetical protein